jgi:hypothetical protein
VDENSKTDPIERVNFCHYGRCKNHDVIEENDRFCEINKLKRVFTSAALYAQEGLEIDTFP